MRQNLLAGVEELIDRNVSYLNCWDLIITVDLIIGNNVRNRKE